MTICRKNIRDDTLSHSSADTTNLDILEHDDDTVALFQKRNCKVCLSVGVHRSSVHLIVSTLDTGVGPNLVGRSFLRPSWRKLVRAVVKLELKSASI